MPTLNVDILDSIFTYLTVHEALGSSTLCKAVHAIVIRKVLSRGVVLSTLEQIDRFPRFIFADSSNRLPFLHELTMKVTDVPGGVHDILTTDDEQLLLPFQNFADFLTTVLTHSRHLRALSLTLSGFFFAQYPNLRNALVMYGDLTDLTLHDLNEEALQVVKNMMASNLRVLSLCYPIDDSICLSAPLLSYIAAHQQLRKLLLSTGSDAHLAWNLGTLSQPLYAVQELEVRGPASLGMLAAVFPNVRSLRTSLLQTPDMPSQNQWQSLDYLCGDCAEFCVWQIRCSVLWLELSEVIRGDLNSRRADDLFPAANMTDVIQWTQPLVLTFSARYDAGQDLWTNLALVVRQVKLLELTIRLEPDDEYPGWLPALVAGWIVSVMGCQKMKHLPTIVIL